MTQPTTVILPTNPKDIERVKAAVKESNDCLIRMQSERDEMKAIAEVMQEELNIPKKFFNRMVRVYNKASFDKEIKEVEEFESLYETIMK
jgi:hypothetical protein